MILIIYIYICDLDNIFFEITKILSYMKDVCIIYYSFFCNYISKDLLRLTCKLVWKGFISKFRHGLLCSC